ncbi:MAG TPA: apolipoprotein N-acyltransferase [Bacteroidota bacterium]|nr:apolipoprotein N-acyltransferase [Bacteroidota bacterium]
MRFPFTKETLRYRSPDHLAARKLFHVRVGLCVLSGALLGAAFPPSTLGVLACFGLVPLLIVIADIPATGLALRYTYLAMFVFHVITLNWTGGYVEMKDPYMMIAGAVTMIVHPFFYWLPIGCYLYVRKRLGSMTALLALPFLWVGYEYSHTLSEWSFPWLTLGNTQSFDLARIQIAEFTGVLGISFWIVVLNVVAFLVYSAAAQRKEFPLRLGVRPLLTVFIVLFLAPLVFGLVVLSTASVDGEHPAMDRGTVTVGLVQPNLDPWERWSAHGREILEKCWSLTDRLVRETPRPQIVLWPETVMPYFLLTPSNAWLLNETRSRAAQDSVAVLLGLPQMVEYPDASRAPKSSRTDAATGERYDIFNAAAFIQPGQDSVPWYGKMKMVPIAERVPYAEFFSGLDFLRWGVGIGGWQIGPGHVVFKDERSGAAFSTAICYESVYPAFIAESVRKGAEFLTIITVDSWWDHMSGAYQHERFAVFRAIENRRWIARCALGGISCFIDPYGRVYDATALMTTAALSRTIGRSAELTAYTRHGELVGICCIWATGLFLALAAGRAFYERTRRNQWQQG